uniref:Uncharacterized protein n=1 Tax=Anguilla anguilla TaxID=7936 RepID=A0A0E9R1B8_ANGAN
MNSFTCYNRKVHDQSTGHFVNNHRWKTPPEYFTLNIPFRLLYKQIYRRTNMGYNYK